MSAEIISFRSARDLMKCELVPSGRVARQRSLERQIDRISNLLEEVEQLAGAAEDMSPALVERTQATLERARRVLEKVRLDEEQGDPQPEVDRALLERLYRELKP